MKDPQCKEKESEIVSSVLQTGVDNPTETLKSETDCRTLETDAEKLTEAVKSETVSDGGTEKTEVEADGESKKEETETGDGTGTAEAIADKESAEKTQMDTSEKKGKWGLKKWPLPFEDDLDKIDIPFPESCSKCKYMYLFLCPGHDNGRGIKCYPCPSVSMYVRMYVLT